MHALRRRDGRALVSVVIPIYEEEETLPELERRLTRTLRDEDLDYEIVFVNDGSRDGSLALVRDMSARDPHIRGIDFSRNFGHQAALYAGLRRARGDAVILMDGDLQDPPEVLPGMIAQWRNGFDVVYAVRQHRKEGPVRRFLYAAFYRVLARISYVRIPLDSGDFSLMDRRVVQELAQLPERNKFLRGLRAWVGFAQTHYPYERDTRFAGTPKYTGYKLVKLALDGLFSYSFVPLRVVYALGFAVSGASFLLAVVYFGQRLLSAQYIPQGFTTIAVLILFLGGVQLLAVGVLGEYVGRVYDEVKRRPEYIERELIGDFEASPAAPRGANDPHGP